MYVILVYDFSEKRVSKMLKLCRKYLNWVQNSVFEGEISEAKLKELLLICDSFMIRDEDSIVIFSGNSKNVINKRIVGKERANIDIFL